MAALRVRPSFWTIAVALAVGVPGAGALATSGVANRLSYLAVGMLLALASGILLRRVWRQRRRREVGILLCLEASLAAAGLGLLQRLDGGALAVGVRAETASLAPLAAMLPLASWLAAALFAALAMGIGLRRSGGEEEDGVEEDDGTGERSA